MTPRRSCIALAFMMALLLPRPGRALSIAISSEGHAVRNFIDHHVPGDQYATIDVQQTQSNDQGGASLSNDLGYASTYGNSSSFTLYAEATADGTNLASLGFDSVSGEADAYLTIDFQITGTTGPVDLLISPTYSVTDVSTDPTPGFAQPGTTTGHLHQLYILQNGQQIFGALPDSSPITVSLMGGVVCRLELTDNAVAGVRSSTGNAHATTTLSIALSATVPEPGTALLLGVALAAVGLGGHSGRSPRGSSPRNGTPGPEPGRV